MNTVAHHHVTIAREDYLGVNHWNDPEHHYYYHDHFFTFRSRSASAAASRGRAAPSTTGYYLPVLMKDFADRGGKIEYRRIEESDDIAPLVGRFDLLVVSSGKGPLGQLFAYRPEHSPYSQPQRRLCVGPLYRCSRAAGSDERDTLSVLRRGHGEMIVIPTITFGGIASALLMENVPGRRHGGAVRRSATRQTQAFPARAVLGSSRSIIRPLYDRSTLRGSISRSRSIFLQGRWCRRFATRWWNSTAANAPSRSASVHSVVDPMMGQGANVASYAAFVLGEEIVNADVLDARFLRKGRPEAAGPRAGGRRAGPTSCCSRLRKRSAC